MKRDQQIQEVLDFIQSQFGIDKISPYGSDWSDPHSVCFKIVNVPATFSVHTQDGSIPDGFVDVQIEGVPPGDYIVTDVTSTQTFLSFVSKLSTSLEDDWPTTIK